MRSKHLFVILCLLAAAIPSRAGTFKDRDGATHPWDVDQTHTLIWEGSPYMPFGVVFEPRYLSLGQTDENWNADAEDIQAFKLAGINDIVVRPAKGLSAAPTEAVQRFIDMLESSGLRYGIEVYEPINAPISGYVIQPTVNRVDGVIGGEVTRDIKDADFAIYAVCDARTGEVKDFGREAVSDGQVKIRLATQTGATHVMLFYPRRSIADGSLFNVWNAYDSHRDRMISYLTKLKFGKGLRFFIDPFTENIGITGDVDSLVPTSTMFRYEYAIWLSKKYSSPGDLNIAWAILKHDITSFDEAARLIPLWREGRGTPIVYDDGTANTYPVDALRSLMWADFRDFRAASVRSYMDAMADVMKRVAADVPVIYSANGLNGMFQTSGAVGYDGLAVPGSGNGNDLFDAAGKTLSMAEGSSRRVWIVSRLKPSGNAYEKKQDLFAAMNAVHDLGVKGFLVSDARGSGVEGANLISWLGEYAKLSVDDKAYAAYRPRVVYYPQNVMRTKMKKLSTGAWWLPSLTFGRDLYLGDSFAGYAYNDPRKVDTFVCVWSLKGAQTIHLVADKPITVTTASGSVMEIKPKKDRIEFPVGEEPLFVRGMSEEQFLPVEVVAEAMQDLLDTIGRAELKRMDTGEYKAKLRNAAEMLNRNQLTLALDLLHETTDDLSRRLRGLEIMPGAGAEKASGK